MLDILKQKLLQINFKSANYWENRYKEGGNSGAGSYGKKAIYKAEVLNSIIDRYKIKSLIEFGCGDGNNLQYYLINYYIGFDVSRTAIKHCLKKYDDINKTFIHYDPTLFKSGGLKSELTISLEVIFHLIEDEVYEKYMLDLFTSSSKYCLIFSTNYNEDNSSSLHVRHREFIHKVPSNYKLIETIKTPLDGDNRLLSSDYYLFERI